MAGLIIWHGGQLKHNSVTEPLRHTVQRQVLATHTGSPMIGSQAC